MTKEQEVILEILKYDSSEKLINLLNDDSINWINVLGYLTYHRIAGLAYEKVNNINIRLFDFPVFFTTYMINQSQKVRTLEQNKWINTISKELNNRNINHVFLKGAILNNCLFNCGARASNDIDILVKKSDISEVTSVLKKLGFIQGKYNYKKKKIEEYSQKEIMNSVNNRGETAPFIKISDDPNIKTIDIDVNFSLDWNTNISEQTINSFLNSKIQIKNSNEEFIYSLDYKYNFLQLCCHLYKDSALIDIIKKRKVLDLYKFVDIYYFIKKYFNLIDVDDLYLEIEKYNLKQQVFFSLKCIIVLFPDSQSEKIKKLINKLDGDNSTLNTIFDQYNPNLKMKTNNDLIERIFSYNIIKHYKEEKNDKSN